MSGAEETRLIQAVYSDAELKPISVALHAQEIGQLTAARTSPGAFTQRLLQEFRNAGAPVEGVVHLRLAAGRIYKMKAHPWGREWLGYMWLPDEMTRRLKSWRAANGVAGAGDRALEEGALVQ